MNWPEAFAIFFAFIGMSLFFHGFPDIKIGGKHYYNNKNDDDE